ncbi:hypothetical protein ACFLUA_04855 [Chloroflexota bacterium]
MKRYLLLISVLALSILFIVMIVNGIGLAQEPDNDIPVSSWSSSDPIPEGVRVTSPPDQQALVDALDYEVEQSYNASIRIAGSALKPRESNVEYTGVGGAGGRIYASSGSASAVFSIPIYLPQGATVRYFRMYYNDQNSGVNTSAWLTVYDLYGVIEEEWDVSSSGTGKTYATTSQLSHEIDYNDYSYVINWRPYELGSDMQVCGFRIYYQTPPGYTYIPYIEK